MVNAKDFTLELIFPLIKQWWDQVIVHPELRRIKEFNKGIPIGSKIEIPIGGHIAPNSTSGEILKWKNLQKNLAKNITSDTMNITILYFNKLTIVLECSPK